MKKQIDRSLNNNLIIVAETDFIIEAAVPEIIFT
jgi:hypothetical protein